MIYRSSQYFIPVLKETPAEAEIVSHRLMLRAGLIQQVALGIYNWLPLGLRVVKKIEQVVREEMEFIGCHELLMPGVQPAALWQESGRWQGYGKELLRFSDRHNREYCLGPTHEEVITRLVKSWAQSYQDLPVSLFQIQTKFRDEIRPRFGVMRSREFVMKDAYSFNLDKDDLQQSYDQMETAYNHIFNRLGVQYRVVDADTGAIGGAVSREFHALTPNGEDLLVTSTASDYAANIELAECPLQPDTPPAREQLKEVATPDCDSMEKLAAQLECEVDNCLKLLLVHHHESTAEQPRLLALALRGGDVLNSIKTEKLSEVASPLRLAEKPLLEAMGFAVGYIGPRQLPCELIADRAALGMADFVCGANIEGMHLTGANWGRDCTYVKVADLRNIREGETCPDGGKAVLSRGSELGHIFQLGDKYTKAMRMRVVGKMGEMVTPLMGCYGIGITRIVAAHIEQSHDDGGIIWSAKLNPFSVHLLQLSAAATVRKMGEHLARTLHQEGFEALLEDRPLRPGVMFSSADLIGIPWQVVISERNLAKRLLEVKHRASGEKFMLKPGELVHFLRKKQE